MATGLPADVLMRDKSLHSAPPLWPRVTSSWAKLLRGFSLHLLHFHLPPKSQTDPKRPEPTRTEPPHLEPDHRDTATTNCSIRLPSLSLHYRVQGDGEVNRISFSFSSKQATGSDILSSAHRFTPQFKTTNRKASPGTESGEAAAARARIEKVKTVP